MSSFGPVFCDNAWIRNIGCKFTPYINNVPPSGVWNLPHRSESVTRGGAKTSVWARRARGAMDNASAYGAEDSRFESWRARR